MLRCLAAVALQAARPEGFQLLGFQRHRYTTQRHLGDENGRRIGEGRIEGVIPTPHPQGSDVASRRRQKEAGLAVPPARLPHRPGGVEKRHPCQCLRDGFPLEAACRQGQGTLLG
jgi:hypothetical protein